MSQMYAIASLGEAQAYLRHAVLGPRLIECARIVANSHAASAEEIFGGIDALKLCSSMTLFMRADPDEAVFRQVLDHYCGGGPDAGTDERLR
jgi:uncharacterized protein (DUF1810 family)